MAGRIPLRALLRDMVMMLCGSFLGILLARGFITHDLNMADISHLCGAVQVSKKVERSTNNLPWREGSGLEEERKIISGIYPYLKNTGSSGSAFVEKIGWGRADLAAPFLRSEGVFVMMLLLYRVAGF